MEILDELPRLVHLLCEEHIVEDGVDDGLAHDCPECARLYHEFKNCNTENDIIAQIALYDVDTVH